MKANELQINGQVYELTYDFNAIADAEEVAGCNLLAALEDLSNLTANQLRGLLYAAIAVPDVNGRPGPRPSVLDCGGMIRLDTIGPITAALAVAYELALPASAKAAPKPAAVDTPAADADATTGLHAVPLAG